MISATVKSVRQLVVAVQSLEKIPLRHAQETFPKQFFKVENNSISYTGMRWAARITCVPRLGDAEWRITYMYARQPTVAGANLTYAPIQR